MSDRFYRQKSDQPTLSEAISQLNHATHQVIEAMRIIPVLVTAAEMLTQAIQNATETAELASGWIPANVDEPQPEPSTGRRQDLEGQRVLFED